MTITQKALFACTFLFCTPLFAKHDQPALVLENQHIAVAFDAKSGALIRLTDKNTGWEIMRREALGQSFELLLPMEGKQMTDADRRYNIVKGIQQDRPVIEKSENRISFTWSGMKSAFMDQKADITFKGEVCLTEKGIEFSGAVVNNSPYTVEYVSWPCIGEVTVPNQSQPLFQSTRSDVKELFPHFNNQHGYWGVEYPTSTCVLPEKSFLQVNNNDRGFMVYHRHLPKNMTITSFELIPGYEMQGVNPYEDEMDGEMVRIQFKANHVLFDRPGGSVTLDPIQFVTYKGAWTEGVDLYKNDRINLVGSSKRATPDWLNSPLTWRKVNIGNADDLLRYAEESILLGVDVLLVNGWYGRADSHVSEVDGLEAAIAQCQRAGLHIVLTTNWTNVDRHAQGYKEKLREYVMVDPYHMPYNFTDLCPSAPAVQQMVKSEWLELPALRIADGYMNTDANHNNKSFLCFDTNHNHRYGEPTVTGMMQMDAEMAKALVDSNDKAALGEGFIEYENDIYDGCRITAPDDLYARYRYTSPTTAMIAPVNVRNARRGMNKALLNRMNIAYDLDFFSDRLSDYPHITEYGNQLEALRKQYADYIWNASFADHKGATVQGENIEYAVFVTLYGKRAIVIANMSNDNATEVTATLDGGTTNLIYVTPESPEGKTFHRTFELAPLSAAVIIEK